MEKANDSRHGQRGHQARAKVSTASIHGALKPAQVGCFSMDILSVKWKIHERASIEGVPLL
jgi:hypothetical protein